MRVRVIASSAVAFLATWVYAAPIEERAVLPPDAPLKVSIAQAKALITCPLGLDRRAKGGVVLLIHGTGSTGKESWGSGPYVSVLPKISPGYSVCYIDLPGRTLGDCQTTAEYVVRAIQYLAPNSYTKKVTTIGHSQGAGANPQWAVIFWPSIRSLISQHFALAGDYRGTILLNFLGLANQGSAALKQQSLGSHYMLAQNSMLPQGGGRALVKTTSIWTVMDDVVQPESPRMYATSNLQGSTAHAVQDLDVCGPLHVADHFTMIIDSAAFGLIKAALQGTAFDPTYCIYIREAPLGMFDKLPGLAQAVVADVVADFTAAPVPEPPLRKYVCDRGFADQCAST